jgi:hypothetical protein
VPLVAEYGEREKSDVAKVLRALSKLLRDFIRALLAGPLEDVSQRAQIMSLEDRIIYAELGRRQREWVDGESLRRSRLAPENFCEASILSYPRSGNHFLRFLVEAATGRPTLGASDHEMHLTPRGFMDLPIFLRLENLDVRESRPVLVKRHTTREGDEFSKVVFLVRNPVEAILSHLRDCSHEKFPSRANLAVTMFSQNFAYVRELPLGTTLTVDCEELLSNSAQVLTSVLDFLEVTVSKGRFERALENTSLAFNSLTRAAKAERQTSYAEEDPKRAIIVRTLLGTAGLGQGEIDSLK